jgi:hypothetical protein
MNFRESYLEAGTKDDSKLVDARKLAHGIPPIRD